MKLDELLDLLEGVRPAGNGFVALCPSHEDREASLTVGEGEEGRILVNCQAKCTTTEVMAALGLQLRDLFPARQSTYGEPEALYEYCDEQGHVLYEVLRMPGKRFRQRHNAPEHIDAKPDGYVYNLDDVRRVPYKLPELLAGVTAGKGVWIAEGEKDVESLMRAGVVATNSKNWREEWCQLLAGATVTIIADRDEPGRSTANKVREMLTPHAAHLRVLQAREGKDATDHFAAGHGLAEFMPIRQGPRRGIITAQQMVEAARESLHQSEQDTPGYPMLPGFGHIIFRPGRMYALGAYQSDGKSRMALQIARYLCSQGQHVAYRSLEMPERDLRNILISHRGVPFAMLENAPWEIPQHPQIHELFEVALSEMVEWKLDIAFNSKVTAGEIVKDAIEREHDFVIIDHVHRLNWGGERRGLEDAIQSLTNLALEQNIPVLMLCQLRKVSRGKDMVAFPNPTIQEFRETSVIADDASMALSLWRQRDTSGIRFTGGTNLTILKNRHTTGRHDAAGTIFLPTYDIQTQTFTINTGGIHAVEPGGSVGADQGEQGDEWGSLYD